MIREDGYIYSHYNTYPIENLEELKTCKMKVGSKSVYIEGTAHALFDVNVKPVSEKVIKVNKKVVLDNNDEALLKTVTQTDLTLTLKFANISQDLSSFDSIKIVTKDGADIFWVDIEADLGSEGLCVYDVSEIKGKIEKILVGGVEVKLN